MENEKIVLVNDSDYKEAFIRLVTLMDGRLQFPTEMWNSVNVINHKDMVIEFNPMEVSRIVKDGFEYRQLDGWVRVGIE